MNNTYSPEQLPKTKNLVANLIFLQSNVDLRSRFLEIKSTNPKKQEYK